MHHFWKSGIYSLSSDTCVKKPTVSQALAPSLGVASSALSCSAPLVLSRCEDCLSWFLARHCGFALPMFCYILLCSKVEWFERGGGERQREAMWIPPIFVSAWGTCSSHITITSAMALLILLLKHPWGFFFFFLGLMNEKKKSKTNWSSSKESKGSFGTPFLG